MIRRIPERSGNSLLADLAEDLGLSGTSGEVDLTSMAVCREFAFTSSTADEFSYWYLRSEIFSKYGNGPDAMRAQAALATFRETEQLVEGVNSRLVDPWTRASLDQSVFRKARGICHGILGSFPWELFPEMCRFGPGATSGLRRHDASHQKKWDSSSHITERALPYHRAFVRWSTLDIPTSVEVVEGNRVTTVPKSFKTDRTIAIEPDWNMFFQLGVGGLIRRRLQRHGLLLPDAQEKNSALARLGSWTGSLATLDLSAASDSISLALCEALLPDDWLKVMYDLRSPKGVLPDGSEVTYAKISSMGNGFTFELETLLFYCLVLAVSGNGNRMRVAVYGDDIICPTDCAESVSAVLSQAGFKLNDDKSFSSGPFRESCGGHFFLGRDVTPFYVRHPLHYLGDAIVLGNSFITYLSNREIPETESLQRTYRALRRFIPRSLYGPFGCDGTWWEEWDRACPRWNIDFQSYAQRHVAREHRYTDVSDWRGSYFHKLWTNVPEVVASRLPRTVSKEVLKTRYLCRGAWSKLPVRIA